MTNWLKILEAFRDCKFPRYYYGLTPRFIIGASQIPIGKIFDTRELAYQATRQMFDEMRTFNVDGQIVVSNNCHLHTGPVMSLTHEEWNESKIGTSFDEIWSRYGDEIVAGNYHIDSSERTILEEIYST